jgi:hypothetical protein
MMVHSFTDLLWNFGTGIAFGAGWAVCTWVVGKRLK